jgi:hypothetical protein
VLLLSPRKGALALRRELGCYPPTDQLSTSGWPPTGTSGDPVLTMMDRVEEVHAFLRSRTRAQMLATAAPFNTPWLPPGYGQKLCEAA